MYYLFDQNNSGGFFEVNDKLCHRLFIEANSLEEATKKAEELGCYWDGVASGIDCSCCGDRWYGGDEIDMDQLREYSVVDFRSEESWYRQYGKYTVADPPKYEKSFNIGRFAGKISFLTIEEYAQYLANEYGWTTPDSRIYYADGTVKEIFREV